MLLINVLFRQVELLQSGKKPRQEQGNMRINYKIKAWVEITDQFIEPQIKACSVPQSEQ